MDWNWVFTIYGALVGTVGIGFGWWTWREALQERVKVTCQADHLPVPPFARLDVVVKNVGRRDVFVKAVSLVYGPHSMYCPLDEFDGDVRPLKSGARCVFRTPNNANLFFEYLSDRDPDVVAIAVDSDIRTLKWLNDNQLKVCIRHLAAWSKAGRVGG
jgi:hypothetical protein